MIKKEGSPRHAPSLSSLVLLSSNFYGPLHFMWPFLSRSDLTSSASAQLLAFVGQPVSFNSLRKEFSQIARFFSHSFPYVHGRPRKFPGPSKQRHSFHERERRGALRKYVLARFDKLMAKLDVKIKSVPIAFTAARTFGRFSELGIFPLVQIGTQWTVKMHFVYRGTPNSEPGISNFYEH